MSSTSSTLNLDDPGVCHYCDSVNTRAVLLPWKASEGWWSCAACMDKVVAHMHKVMNQRRILGTNVLPEWFRRRGSFWVQRSGGSLTMMDIVDFVCDFSKNADNGDSTEGRVQLSSGHIFVDMYYEDERGTFRFKQVMLQNLYENNADMREEFELTLPKWVDKDARKEWHAAVLRAVVAGKKNIDLGTDPDASEVTDIECDTTVSRLAPATPGNEESEVAAEEAIEVDDDGAEIKAAKVKVASSEQEVTVIAPANTCAKLSASAVGTPAATPAVKPYTYLDDDDYPPPPTNATVSFY